jgi:hypothetical protein
MTSLPEYPSNRSTKPNQQRRRVDPVVSGGVTYRRSTAGNIRKVGNGLFEEIIMPAVKEMIFSFFSSGARMLIFGDDQDGYRASPRGRQSYNSRYRPQSRAQSNIRSVRRAAPVEQSPPLEGYQDVVFANLDDARGVLGQLQNLILDYGNATLGDFYNLAGIGAPNYTYQRYGWTDLTGVRVETYHDGHVIALPDLEFFNN